MTITLQIIVLLIATVAVIRSMYLSKKNYKLENYIRQAKITLQSANECVEEYKKENEGLANMLYERATPTEKRKINKLVKDIQK